ncbi:nitroreductase family protein [Streptomyces heilongjiangensis]|uniref:SagB/ThcOx family dehydrogenase n=1 Tax=Streptomyces heilongjiangensis TaxID=945052 RepID=A0ABW1B6X0_9ACTN|nr:SagB/ThcOx family dehydrogenase [Streptomyces heilongjiangensis]MDC2947586.1 SagB/ThcOx family dehydrogenase [Streptomyces heilongjiangensis]
MDLTQERVDLVTALARARSRERPGPDTSAGPVVRAWPGPAHALPQAAPGQLDLDRLLRLSLAASDGSGRLRPAPSAGGLHPVDAQLVVGTGCPLPPGRYGYDPLRHRAHRLGPGAGGTLPGATVELTVTPRRTVSHYGHRAWPLLLLDTGHVAAALWLAARALDTAEPVLHLDGPHEGPLAAVHFTPHRPGQVSPPEGAGPPADVPAPGDLPARRSAAPPLTGTPSRDALRAVLATAVRAGAGELAWCAAVGEPRPELVESAPDGTLRRLAAGEARPTLAAWAAGQAWLADAGAVLLAYGCPADADATLIRRTHLRAGFAVHLAHLAAVRRGLAARPVGSWQQADLGAALGGPPGRDWIVHGLALGTTHPDEEKTS